jgi:hypothetical protein
MAATGPGGERLHNSARSDTSSCLLLKEAVGCFEKNVSFAVVLLQVQKPNYMYSTSNYSVVGRLTALGGVPLVSLCSTCQREKV